MSKSAILIIIFFFLFKTISGQKGEKSIAVGLLLALPNEVDASPNYFAEGLGLEGIGQYNLTDKGAVLLQLQITYFQGLSLKGGYRHQLSPSGFYANVLAGVEQVRDARLDIAAALGAGKRFTISRAYFIDTGIDYVISNISRFNFRAVFSILRRPKKY